MSDRKLPQPARRMALRISLLYTLFAGLWIYASDALIATLVGDIELLSKLQNYKGGLFTAVTALLLYLLINALYASVAVGEVPGSIAEVASSNGGFSRQPPGSRLWPPLLLFMLVASGSAAAGYVVFERQREIIKTSEYDKLSAVADLKVNQLTHWVAERRSEGIVQAGDAWLAGEIERWLQEGAPPGETGRRILTRLAILQQTGRYRAVILVDAQGQPRLAAGSYFGLPPGQVALVREAMRSQNVMLSDLHFLAGNVPSLSVIAPLNLTVDGFTQTVGALCIEIDPEEYFFPLIQSWPTPSASAETLLVRREGDEVMFLNELRHRQGTTLTLRLPVSQERLPAAMAVRGFEGVSEGKDYRSVPVLAALRKVPGSPWFLVAKIDTAEVYAPIYRLALLITSLVIAFIGGIGGGIALWWRQQYAHYLAEQYRTELERQALAKHFDYLTKYANDIILLVDGNTGRIVEANDRALAAYGYTRDELLQLPERTLQAPETLSDFEARLAGNPDGVVFETMHRRKDGSQFPVEVSSRSIAVGERRFVQSIIRDISERKQSEVRLQLWSKIFENVTEGILIANAQAAIIAINPAFTQLTGYALEEVVGESPRLLKSGRHDEAFYQNMWASIQRTGYWRGEIWNRRKSGEIYPEWLSISTVRDERGELIYYIGSFTDITERKAADDRIYFLAHYDALTELPNRALLTDRLNHAIVSAQRSGNRVAILFLDLDRFKDINDSLGHDVGDRVLRLVSERLKGCMREADTIARIGGDEFIIVLPDLREAEDAAIVAEKIFSTLAKTFAVDARELNVLPSIGISIYPDDGADVTTLIKNADAAMYHAKDMGRGNYQFFTQDLNAKASHVLAMETSLRHALEREEFLLYYQPQVEIESGRIIGAEALLRWQHPDMGLVSPSQFIPLAEERGLIMPIGEWVLRTACADNRAWQEAGLLPVPVAVNMSAVQFRQKEMVDNIAAILQETGLDPNYLELELTESIIMREAELTISMVKKLQAMGLRLSIDDFGTGYSSLSYLQRFPIHKLKIDRSFVRELAFSKDARAIASAIISMAKSLKLRVIAEGVETPEQLAFLRLSECDEVQGYYFSKPLAVEEFTKLLGHVYLGRVSDL